MSIRFWTVLRRETTRFWSIKKQTILAPLLETYLYISIFGAALGSRIKELDGVPYITYIIPGLIMMALAMNAFSNNTSSIIQQKFQRAMDDQLASPVTHGELLAAFTLGGFLRGLVIATLTFVTASVLIDLPVEHPFLLLASVIAVGGFFSSLGVLIGIRAENFDNISFYQTFVLQPLIFLGGVFYSASLLPEPYQTLSHFNPVFYMINTVRYAFLGRSDVDPYLSLGILTAVTTALVVTNLVLFRRGYKLRA